MPIFPRTVCWFSAGAASAVAARLTIASHADREIVIVRELLDGEHPDNERFARDCAAWFGREITTIRSEKYRDHWQVIEERRFISGPEGALCTVELKKVPRFAFQRVDDVHIFGFTADKRDMKRAERMRQQNPELTIETPLIDAGLRHADCLAIIERASIVLPAMYLLGFLNNNCIACSKARSPKYWRRIKRHFPPEFWRMARLQREIGYTQVRLADDTPVYLDELPDEPGAGELDDEPDIECSLLCFIAEQSIAAGA